MNALLERNETEARRTRKRETNEAEAPRVEVADKGEVGGGDHRPENTIDGRPDPSWVRGKCPECGEELVSNLYYVGGKGYLLIWECWASLGDNPLCHYRRVL